MADTLLIHLGRATLDVETRVGESGISIAKVTSKLSFAETLKEVLASINLAPVRDVQITARWLDWIVQRRLGTPVALVTTQGFESILEMSGNYKKGWTLHPRRWRMPIERHLIFGISERTSADGEVLKAVTDEDVQFLIEKLKMHNVSKVAVVLMHSPKNSANEDRVVQILRDNGFNAFQVHPSRRDMPALHFWGQLLVTTYADAFYREEFAQLLSVLESFHISQDRVSIPGFHPTPSHEQPLSWPIFHDHCARILTSYEPGAHTSCIYCGLEEFIFIPPTGEVKNLTPHPLHKLRFDAWKSPLLKEHDQVDWEPGPMLLGKSVEPTYLDMIGVAGLATPFDTLGMTVTPAARTRTEQAVDMMARSQYGTSVANFAHQVTCFLAQTWAEQLLLAGSRQKLVLTGPLARTIFEVLNEIRFPFEFEVSREHA